MDWYWDIATLSNISKGTKLSRWSLKSNEAKLKNEIKFRTEQIIYI